MTASFQSHQSVRSCNGARVNNVTLSVVYDHMLDIRRFSHMLDPVGDKMTSPILDDLIKGWISPFSHSCKARLAYSLENPDRAIYSNLLSNSLVE